MASENEHRDWKADATVIATDGILKYLNGMGPESSISACVAAAAVLAHENGLPLEALIKTVEAGKDTPSRQGMIQCADEIVSSFQVFLFTL
jgi:hypothetical protein